MNDTNKRKQSQCLLKFGISRLPDWEDNAAFLDELVAKGHRAFELPFTRGFPWRIEQCREFGELAAERDLAVSVHAPYFAVLTTEDEDKAKQCSAALEHTMKLGAALGAKIICAHLGARYQASAEELVERVSARLALLAPKLEYLGVGLGLETAGNDRSFGTLGDIAHFANEFPFVRPLVDWAHIHAVTGGGLTSPEAFAQVFAFIKSAFPAWMIDPLQCQFSDNEVGTHGEIRHVPYGDGTLRIAPLVEAARQAGVGMVVISEARDQESHERIYAELKEAMEETNRVASSMRPISTLGLPDRILINGGDDMPLGVSRPLRLSNIDKPFFSDGYTKGDLIQYYAAIAPVLLPHLEDRAIVMARFPDGADGSFFYEKQAPGHQPDWMELASIESRHRGRPIEYVTASSKEALMWLANMGCIEIHPWLSRLATLDYPDCAIFDLDPSEGCTWQDVVDTAGVLRVALDGLGLASAVKTSGATGLHVHVPLDPVHPYDRVRGFVEKVGRLLVEAAPDMITMEWDIPKRNGRVFVDHNQNVAGKTIASVYSVRPRSGAPVSAPIMWNEIDQVNPDDFTIESVWDRLQRYGDLFAPVLQGGQVLDAAEEAIGISTR